MSKFKNKFVKTKGNYMTLDGIISQLKKFIKPKSHTVNILCTVFWKIQENFCDKS